jgi:hypothetical protein
MFGATCKKYYITCGTKGMEADALWGAIMDGDKAVIEHLDPLFSVVRIVPDAFMFIPESVAFATICRGSMRMTYNDGLYNVEDPGDLAVVGLTDGRVPYGTFISWGMVISFIASGSNARSVNLINFLFEKVDMWTSHWLCVLLNYFGKKMEKIIDKSACVFKPMRNISAYFHGSPRTREYMTRKMAEQCPMVKKLLFFPAFKN